MSTPSKRFADKDDLKSLARSAHATYEPKDSSIVHDSEYVHTDENFSSALKAKLESLGEGAVTGVRGSSETSYRTGKVEISKSNIGLGNVENKSSATIRSEITSANVTSALGYTPPQSDTTYTARTTSVGSASAGTAIAADDITEWSAGTVPSLTINDETVKSVKSFSAGTLPSLTVTSKSVPNVTSVGTKPSLTITSTSVVGNVTSTNGTAATASVSKGVLTITDGSVPVTSVTAGTTSVGSASNWSAGTTPTLGSAILLGSASGWSAGTAPSLTTEDVEVGSASGWSAGTAPSLSYTERSIPNISVTNKAVVTGITAD